MLSGDIANTNVQVIEMTQSDIDNAPYYRGERSETFLSRHLGTKKIGVGTIHVNVT